MVIYKATSPNNKVYIGLTRYSLEKRKYRHKCTMVSKKTRNYKFYNALNKYGFENFKWEVIDTASTYSELLKKEQYYIKLYDSKTNGYNSTIGGEGVVGNTVTIEQKLKYSESNKKYWNSMTPEQVHEKTKHLRGKPAHNRKKIKDSFNNIFNSMSEAAQFHNLTVSGVSHILKTKRLNRKGLGFTYESICTIKG